jgi:hypothetical protein
MRVDVFLRNDATALPGTKQTTAVQAAEAAQRSN